MTEKPKKPIEQMVGTVAALCAVTWGFKGFLAVIDWISRAETAVAVMPYLWIAGTPAGFLVEFLLGVFSLVYATRLERSRELDETPRIIPAWGSPATPKRRRRWIKLTCAALVASGIAAFAAFRIVQPRPLSTNSRPGPRPAQTIPQPESSEQSFSVKADEPPSGRPRSNKPNTEISKEGPKKGGAAPETRNDPQVTVDIPVPANSGKRAGPERAPVPIKTTIGGKQVVSAEKPPGNLYVTLRLSEVSTYRGTLSQEDLEAVKAALENTRKMRVFEGEYTLKGASDRVYNIGGIGSGEERTIYFFDPVNEPSCKAVQTLITGVVGKDMRCTPMNLQPASGRIDVQWDFVYASGLDLEIVL
jgi:hypothetical protein